MKNKLPLFLFIYLSIAILSCQEEDVDKAPALREMITSSKWTLLKEKKPNATAYTYVSSFFREVYSFKSDGRYIVKYPNFTSLDTIYVEGNWSVLSKPLVVDFLNFDTAYHYRKDIDLPRLIGTPRDWNVITSDSTTIEIEWIAGDSLLGNFCILKKIN